MAQVTAKLIHDARDPLGGLAASVVVQAVKDAQAGRRCDERACRPFGHRCRRDALSFLRSGWCRALLQIVGCEEYHRDVLLSVGG